jgi:hypothetical protein
MPTDEAALAEVRRENERYAAISDRDLCQARALFGQLFDMDIDEARAVFKPFLQFAEETGLLTSGRQARRP